MIRKSKNEIDLVACISENEQIEDKSIIKTCFNFISVNFQYTEKEEQEVSLNLSFTKQISTVSSS